MGKEQELLDAARTGNIVVVEKILSNRAKKAGPLAPLASLRRSANPNCRDATGYTPLHHASLNGHKDVVQLLLCYEASANTIDTKGCYPLHLAAWNGNSEICRILLTHGPSTAKVNEQNNDGDTPLHCASQYGHADTVAVLLEYHAEPVIRNFKDESPLDLAAQYGRLETVQLLLRKHPNLLRDKVDHHGPLHLASRNGHKQVVCVLLEAGLDINVKTECGTALHEAALFGKQDVVRLLLENGIDPHITDSCNRTALEVISEHKSQISLDIGKVISDYVEGRKNPSQRSSFGTGSNSSLSTRHSVGEGVYDNVIPAKPIRSAASSNSSLPLDINTRPYHLQRREFIHDRPYDHRDRESVASEGSICVHESPLLPQRPFSDPLEVLDYEHQSLPTAFSKCAFDSPKSDVSSHSANSSFASSSGLPSPLPSVVMSRASPKGSPRNSPTLRMSGVSVSPDTPKKPPRRKKDGRSSMRFDPDSKKLIANEKNLSSSKESLNKFSHEENKNQEMEKNLEKGKNDNRLQDDNKESLKEKSVLRDVRNSLDFEEKKDEKRDAEKEISEEKTAWRISAMAEDLTTFMSTGLESSDSSRETVKLRSDDSERKHSQASTPSSRPPSLDFSSKRSSREVAPLSPTGYEQPPTPDHPPPSPMTAIIGIQEKINPKDKRRSRDMETITELEFLAEEISRMTKCASKDAVTEPLEGSICQVSTAEGATSQECVEVVNGNDPFLGLQKGSIGPRRVKSQIYDSSVVIERSRGSGGVKHKQKRISAPGLFLHFDPVNEEEERKVSKPVVRSNSHVTTRPKVPPPPPPRMDSASHLVAAVVDSYHNNGKGSSGPKVTTTSTGTDPESPIIDENAEWAKIAEILSSYGGQLEDCENLDVFEQELLQLFKIADIVASFGGGITRGSLCLQDCEDQLNRMITGRMQSVGEWLESLGLSQYENTFVANGFDDLDFMGPCVLEESDLTEMGIDMDEHRKTLLQASSSLPTIKSIADTGMPDSVSQWLHSLRLPEYLDTLNHHGFTTMDRVRNLWELELSTVLDIKILGHRKRIIASLRTLPDDDRWTQDTSTDTGNDWRQESLDAEGSPLSLFRDYTQLRSQCRGDDTSEDALSDELLLDNDLDSPLKSKEAQINIRPPHLAHAESPIKQWRHRPEVLINGCCNYAAQYLGSTVVKQLHGTESTKESINKLKKSAETLGKSPVILLSISYKGVKFVDIKSKKLICEHEIGNIFCACQDGDHMNHFAYITKDLETHRHYCHVFSVKSTELATEIILTLGEAFEIAYQIAVREKQEERGPLQLNDDGEVAAEDPSSSSSSSAPIPPAADAAQSTAQAATWYVRLMH